MICRGIQDIWFRILQYSPRDWHKAVVCSGARTRSSVGCITQLGLSGSRIRPEFASFRKREQHDHLQFRCRHVLARLPDCQHLPRRAQSLAHGRTRRELLPARSVSHPVAATAGRRTVRVSRTSQITPTPGCRATPRRPPVREHCVVRRR